MLICCETKTLWILKLLLKNMTTNVFFKKENNKCSTSIVPACSRNCVPHWSPDLGDNATEPALHCSMHERDRQHTSAVSKTSSNCLTGHVYVHCDDILTSITREQLPHWSCIRALRRHFDFNYSWATASLVMYTCIATTFWLQFLVSNCLAGHVYVHCDNIWLQFLVPWLQFKIWHGDTSSAVILMSSRPGLCSLSRFISSANLTCSFVVVAIVLFIFIWTFTTFSADTHILTFLQCNK